MSRMNDQEAAALFALGSVDGAEREMLRARVVEDKAFAGLVSDWDNRLAPLLPDGESAFPDGLLAKIESVIDAAGFELPGTVTKRAGEGEWTQVYPGLNIKVLNKIEQLNRQTIMVRLDAGCEFHSHEHSQDEEIYMISGDLIIGELTLGPGDFHVARMGRKHPLHRTKTGCVCIISQAIDW
jgi:quercetin dioxygenase-like cupin family protein